MVGPYFGKGSSLISVINTTSKLGLPSNFLQRPCQLRRGWWSPRLLRVRLILRGHRFFFACRSQTLDLRTSSSRAARKLLLSAAQTLDLRTPFSRAARKLLNCVWLEVEGRSAVTVCTLPCVLCAHSPYSNLAARAARSQTLAIRSQTLDLRTW